MAKKKEKKNSLIVHTNVDGVDASRGVGAAAKRDTATVFPRDGTADSLQNQRLFFDEDEEEDLDFSTRG